MIYSNADSIVRRTLLEKSMSIHYYLEFLVHCTACVRELSFDTLQIINTLQLPVNEYGAVDFPDDFDDDLGVSIPYGSRLIPVPKNDSITPLRYHDTTGNYITPTTTNKEGFFGFFPGALWYWNINDYGEPTGRNFGASGASDINGYKVIKERRQIQLTPSFTSDTIVLMYISDGQRADNASMIETKAIAAIQAYINWKRSPNADKELSPEGRAYTNQRRLLRARKDDLTKTDIIHILRRSYSGAMKN